MESEFLLLAESVIRRKLRLSSSFDPRVEPQRTLAKACVCACYMAQNAPGTIALVGSARGNAWLVADYSSRLAEAALSQHPEWFTTQQIIPALNAEIIIYESLWRFLDGEAAPIFSLYHKDARDLLAQIVASRKTNLRGLH